MTGDIARSAHVPAAAIKKAFKNGRLHAGHDGRINPANPMNASYIKKHSRHEHSLATKTRDHVEIKKANGASESFAEAERREKVASANFKEKRAARERMRYYEDIKRSIPYEIVERSFNALGGILEEQFRMFAERNGETYYSAFKAGESVHDFRARLQADIDAGIKNVLAQTERSISGLQRGSTTKEVRTI